MAIDLEYIKTISGIKYEQKIDDMTRSKFLTNAKHKLYLIVVVRVEHKY